MQKKKLFSYKFIFVVATQVCCYSIVEASQEAGSKIVEVVTATKGSTGLQALSVLTLTYQVGNFGWQAAKYFFPTEEEKVQALVTTDNLQSVQMFEQFTTCLLANPKRSSILGDLGIPIVCEIPARQLVKKGAASQVNQMINVYKSDSIRLILKK